MLRNIKEKYQEVSHTVSNTVKNNNPFDSSDDSEDDADHKKVDGSNNKSNDTSNNKSKSQEEDQDLLSILDRSQRGDLMMLVVTVTEAMRSTVEAGFDCPPRRGDHDAAESEKNNMVVGLTEDEVEIERPPVLPPRRKPAPPVPPPARRTIPKDSPVKGDQTLERRMSAIAVSDNGAGGESDSDAKVVGVKTGTLVELEPQPVPHSVPEPAMPEYHRLLSAHSSASSRLAVEKEAATPDVDSWPAPQQTRSDNKPSVISPAALSAAKLRDKNAALSHFSDWADSVILRVGNVVNSDEERGEHKDDLNQDPKDDRDPEDDSSSKRNPIRAVYPPVETPLSELSRAKRLLILRSLLLLLLSLQHYNAYSRVFMLRFASSLNLHVKDLNQDESKVARGLLDAVALSSSANTDARPQKKTDTARLLKVGIATVAGATLIGVTGGLAAPLVAAGLGSVLGGLGLGATAAAGYLGALAGSGVVVGGLFGAYGGRMTGKMMDKYANEVEDFAFLPIHGREAEEMAYNMHDRRDSSKGDIRSRLPRLPWKPSAESEEAQRDHRLRVTICITGWVTQGESDFIVPWRVIGDGTEKFGLRWEFESLLNLGNAISAFVTSAAWGVAGREVLSRTVFAGIMSALTLPFAIIKVSRILDNPFSVAKARADKTGRVLADVLINKAQGERPVTLVGYSLGSRVIYSCLQTLAKRRAYGLVETAIVMGSPIPSDFEDWRAMRNVVTGRLVNVFSKNDTVLAFFYRTSSLQLGVAGLQPIPAAASAGLDVQNVDVSDLISGHLRYQYLLGKIIARIGLVLDINAREAAREEALLTMHEREQEEELVVNEKLAAAARNGPDDAGFVDSRAEEARASSVNESSEEEEARLQVLVERRTKEQLMRRRAEQSRLRRPKWEDADDDDV